MNYDFLEKEVHNKREAAIFFGESILGGVKETGGLSRRNGRFSREKTAAFLKSGVPIAVGRTA